MNSYIKLLKFALLLVLFSFNNIFSQTENFHIVKKGETLYSLSKKFNISVQKLKELNNLSNTSLSIGQKIIYKINNEKPKIVNDDEDLSTNRVEGPLHSLNCFFSISSMSYYLTNHTVIIWCNFITLIYGSINSCSKA